MCISNQPHGQCAQILEEDNQTTFPESYWLWAYFFFRRETVVHSHIISFTMRRATALHPFSPSSFVQKKDSMDLIPTCQSWAFSMKQTSRAGQKIMPLGQGFDAKCQRTFCCILMWAIFFVLPTCHLAYSDRHNPTVHPIWGAEDRPRLNIIHRIRNRRCSTHEFVLYYV